MILLHQFAARVREPLRLWSGHTVGRKNVTYVVSDLSSASPLIWSGSNRPGRGSRGSGSSTWGHRIPGRNSRRWSARPGRPSFSTRRLSSMS